MKKEIDNKKIEKGLVIIYRIFMIIYFLFLMMFIYVMYDFSTLERNSYYDNLVCIIISLGMIIFAVIHLGIIRIERVIRKYLIKEK